MPAPIVAAIISGILGRTQNKSDPYTMGGIKYGTIGDTMQGKRRVYDERYGAYVNEEDSDPAYAARGTQQPMQDRQGMEGVDINQQQVPNKFGKIAGGIQNVAGIIGSLGNRGSQNQPYRMQMTRRA